MTHVRTRFWTGATAAVLAVALAVAGTAKPVKAAVPYAQIAIAVASALFSRGGGGDLERAKREIIDAINSARRDIIAQIDTIASADVRACTDAATTKVLQIDALDEFSLALFANDAVNCATLSSAYFDAVQTPAAADTIGNLIGAIYSIAMVGYTKLGFSTVDLLDRLIRSYEAVAVKMTPTNCTKMTLNGDAPRTFEQFWVCTAYNGDRGFSESVLCGVSSAGVRCVPHPPIRTEAEDRAAANTRMRAMPVPVVVRTPSPNARYVPSPSRRYATAAG
jgi:hypothetical protein